VPVTNQIDETQPDPDNLPMGPNVDAPPPSGFEGVEGALSDEDAAFEAEKAARAELDKLFDRVRSIAADKERLATEVSGKRVTTEDRWYDDTRQFHGRYDEVTEQRLEAANGKKSKLFVRTTRAKCDTWEARLIDLLFPSDERNWGIQPTPVPELGSAMRQFKQGEPQHDQAAALVAQAKLASDAMQAEMDDQLTQCRYAVSARDVVHDAVVLGTGVMKGPVVDGRMRQKWVKAAQQTQDRFGNMVDAWELVSIPDPSPTYVRVDPWRFFPDPNARNMAECEYTFEQHLPNAKELRTWAKRTGWNKNAIQRLLEGGAPKSQVPAYVQTLRQITTKGAMPVEARWLVWEYRGPLTAKEAIDMSVASGDKDMAEAYSKVSELDDVQVCLYVCDGEVLYFGPHLLDSGESLYSTFNFAKDESSVFGYGVPAIMRDSQKAINAAWRMTMDNAGIALGPQIVIDRNGIEPANNSWQLEPMKIWFKKKDTQQGNPAFQAFNIESRQTELAAIIQMAEKFADAETSLPVIAQGEQGSHTTTTANGMAMLMNSANVVFRCVVRSFDDDLTTPSLSRLYQWNMQFNPRQDIKGDLQVDARGTSVLLVRELQAQNLMTLGIQYGSHPIYGKMTKHANLYRKLVQVNMLPADEIVMTDDELKAQADAEAKQGQPPDIELQKLQLQNEISKRESETRKYVADRQHETAVIALASKEGIEVAKVRAMLADNQAERDHKERSQAGEMGFKAQQQTRELVAATKAGFKPKGGDGAAPAAGTKFPP
jgi:hypothetical protein